MANVGSMKHRRLLFLSLIVVALLVGGCGLWVWRAKRQYALNRQLIVALVNNNGKQALALVNAGADPNTRRRSLPAPTFKRLLNQLLHHSPAPADDSSTAFMIACGLRVYATDFSNGIEDTTPEDVPLVRLMLAHGADIKARGMDKSSALDCATLSNYPHVIQLLLQHGANINEQETHGFTPLMYAVMADYTELTGLLLKHGADVSLKDKWGATALHYAVSDKMNKYIIRQLLAHGADPNLSDKDGKAPIVYAQERHRPDIIALLRTDRR